MQPHERLKQVRIETGYRTGTDAAKAMGVTVATYNAHENGHRGLTIHAAERYAKFFNVRSSWLLTGEAPKNYMTQEEMDNFDWSPDPNYGFFVPGHPYMGSAEHAVPEVDGFNSEIEPKNAQGLAVVGHWSLPNDFAENILNVPTANIFLLAAPDDVMSELVRKGDRVIVDASQTTMRGSGFYVLRGGDGHMHIRRITKLIVPEDGRELHLSTDNPPSGSLVKAEQLKIMGKVIGRITAI